MGCPCTIAQYHKIFLQHNGIRLIFDMAINKALGQSMSHFQVHVSLRRRCSLIKEDNHSFYFSFISAIKNYLLRSGATHEYIVL